MSQAVRPADRALRFAAWTPPVLLALYAAFLSYFVVKYVAVAAWPADDAFFFVRYAENFLRTGKFSWNPGEPPVHGNTSQIYQFAVTALYWLTGRNPVQTLIALGVSGLWAAAVVTLWAFVRVNAALDRPRHMIVMVAAALALLLVFDRIGLFHALFAMETTWAAASVALSVVAAQALARAPGSIKARILAGAMIVLVFALRPDAALVPVALLGGLIVWGDRIVRRGAVIAALSGFALLAIYLAACWLYYGAALPLAANMKIYGITEVPSEPFGFYVENVNLLGSILLNNQVLTVVAIACVIDWRSLSPVLRGAAIGLAAFFAYHLLLTFHITGLQGRYYFPGLPLIFILAGSFCVRVLAALDRIDDHARRGTWLRIAALSAGAVLIMQLVVYGARVAPVFREAWQAQHSAGDADRALRKNAESYVFFGGKLTTMVDALDPGCVVASTEDGVLSVLDKGKIVDMSGLHDPQIAQYGFSAERLLIEQRPDILIMPHPALYKWANAIKNHPALLRDYDLEKPSSAPRLFVEIGFRKDSPCAQKVKRAF